MRGNEDRLRGLIGLSRRAGLLSLGTDTVLRQIKSGACGIVLLDTAAAPNTQKRLRDAAQQTDTPVCTVPESLLDAATGQSGKMTAAVRKGTLADQLILWFKTAEEA